MTYSIMTFQSPVTGLYGYVCRVNGGFPEWSSPVYPTPEAAKRAFWAAIEN